MGGACSSAASEHFGLLRGLFSAEGRSVASGRRSRDSRGVRREEPGLLAASGVFSALAGVLDVASGLFDLVALTPSCATPPMTARFFFANAETRGDAGVDARAFVGTRWVVTPVDVDDGTCPLRPRADLARDASVPVALPAMGAALAVDDLDRFAALDHPEDPQGGRDPEAGAAIFFLAS